MHRLVSVHQGTAKWSCCEKEELGPLFPLITRVATGPVLRDLDLPNGVEVEDAGETAAVGRSEGCVAEGNHITAGQAIVQYMAAVVHESAIVHDMQPFRLSCGADSVIVDDFTPLCLETQDDERPAITVYFFPMVSHGCLQGSGWAFRWTYKSNIIYQYSQEYYTIAIVSPSRRFFGII